MGELVQLRKMIKLKSVKTPAGMAPKYEVMDHPSGEPLFIAALPDITKWCREQGYGYVFNTPAIYVLSEKRRKAS